MDLKELEPIVKSNLSVLSGYKSKKFTLAFTFALVSVASGIVAADRDVRVSLGFYLLAALVISVYIRSQSMVEASGVKVIGEANGNGKPVATITASAGGTGGSK